MKGLYQGQPRSGVPLFDSGKENAGECEMNSKQSLSSVNYASSCYRTYLLHNAGWYKKLGFLENGAY